MTDDRLKMWFGFTLTLALVVLAGVIAIGHVAEATSFGLQYILGALSALAGSWGQWAFSGKQVLPRDPNATGGQSFPEQ